MPVRIRNPIPVCVAMLASVCSCMDPPPVDDDAGVDDAGLEPTSDCGFVGTPGEAPVLELLFQDEQHTLQVLVDGGDVPAILPPQLGKVLLIGVRAKNINTCDLAVTAGVFDDCTSPPQLLGREGRPLQLVENPATGFAEPRDPDTLNHLANIPVCPNFRGERDVDGELVRVQFILTDGDGVEHDLQAHVRPFCVDNPNDPNAVADCECECDAEYSFERACEEILRDDDALPTDTCPAVLPAACEPACGPAAICTVDEDGAPVCR